MKSLHPHATALLIAKLGVGIVVALVLAGYDHNGLSPRDLLVGAGTAVATTISLVTAIESGTPIGIAYQLSVSYLMVDAITGLWLNLSPVLDKLGG